MARIREVVNGNQTVRAHDTLVDCYVQVVDAPGSGKLVHLSTFGSPERQSPPKSSQSMQVDEGTARKLIAIFLDTFGTTLLPPTR